MPLNLNLSDALLTIRHYGFGEEDCRGKLPFSPRRNYLLSSWFITGDGLSGLYTATVTGLFGILHRKFIFLPPFIYLFMQSSISVWMHGYFTLCIIIQYYLFFAQIVLARPLEFFQVAPVSFWHGPHPTSFWVFFFLFFFWHTLSFWNCKMLQVPLVYSLPQPLIQPFVKGGLEHSIRNQDLGLAGWKPLSF